MRHVDEAALAAVRERFGEPAVLRWEGEISEREWRLATYNPSRTHDVTLLILNGARLALIRKPHFEQSIWRPPGGGIKPGEDVAAGAVREALEETGLRVRLRRYLVATTALPTRSYGRATRMRSPAPAGGRSTSSPGRYGCGCWRREERSGVTGSRSMTARSRRSTSPPRLRRGCPSARRG